LAEEMGGNIVKKWKNDGIEATDDQNEKGGRRMPKDLICRDEVLDLAYSIRHGGDPSNHPPFECVSVEDIKAAPVVKLVYCRECKHFRAHSGDSWCSRPFGMRDCVDPYDYCSYGEPF
jgi:hypothetical protein